MKNQTEHIDKLYSEKFTDYNFPEAKPDWGDLQTRLSSHTGFRLNIKTFRFMYPVILAGVILIPAFNSKNDLNTDHLKRISSSGTIIHKDNTMNTPDSTDHPGIVTNKENYKIQPNSVITSSVATIEENSNALNTGGKNEDSVIVNITPQFNDSVITTSRSASSTTVVRTPVIANKKIVKGEKSTKLGRRKKK